MMKKNVDDVGMCGCMTSLYPFVNLTWKMGHFKGYVWLFWGCGGAKRAPDREVTPLRC